MIQCVGSREAVQVKNMNPNKIYLLSMKLPALMIPPMVALAAAPPSPGDSCAANGDFSILVSPPSVIPGDTMRVLVAAGEPAAGAAVEVTGPSGPLAAARRLSGGGPSYWWAAEIYVEEEGDYEVHLVNNGDALACRKVKATARRKPRKQGKHLWETEREWTRGAENLYSAWIDILFHDSREGESWNSLHEVTRNPGKNLLHNHLGLGEDDEKGEGSLKMAPDCADSPYFLRAYFSWKLGLPFGVHRCSRGKPGRHPRCGDWTSNNADVTGGSHAQVFQDFLRLVMKTVHSGSPRTALDDDATDLYPVPLTKEHLRPGVVFADPYGHTLTIVRRVPQTEEKPGMLLAVDAQPDGTVGIKRFWRGNFIFATTGVIGEPGFKAFRPIVRKKGEHLLLANKEIAGSGDYGNFSLQQKDMDPDAFYDAMERLINPDPLDPVAAFKDIHEALYEQLLVRVQSVANGEAYMAASGCKVIPMPEGAGIFLASGPWEDYSTPNRDIRLLVAMDVLRDFPDKIVRRPDSFRLPEGATPQSMKEKLLLLHEKWAAELAVTYTRSDGSQQVLTMQEVIKRERAFEAAYNPNDCVEVRWGAPEGSEEISTCRRRAPAGQRKVMEDLRKWFHSRSRPVE